MQRAILFALLLGFLAGCGDRPARVKGQILENGQPKACPSYTASITFTPAGTDATKGVSFTSPINPDGTFQVLVSGGDLPPGKYEIAVQLRASGKGVPTTFRRELKPGSNDLSFDLAKPDD